MTERIQLGPVRGNFLARRAFQTFADDHDAIFQRGNGFFDLGQEFVLQEGNFRYQDEVGRVNGTALRQHGAGGDPPCPTAHDLDDATGAVVRGHAADARGDFHHGRRIVFDDRAVAGAMVGVWQVVVDGFGNADHAHFKAAFDGLVVNLVRGILRVVAAGVKEVADSVRLKNLKEAVHVARGVLRLFLEVDFVTTGAQGGGRRVFQTFDRLAFLLLQVNQIFIKNPEDAVQAAINFLNLIGMPSRFLNNARHAGIDDRCRPAGLRYQQVSSQFSHSFPDGSRTPRICLLPNARFLIQSSQNLANGENGCQKEIPMTVQGRASLTLPPLHGSALSLPARDERRENAPKFERALPT